MKILIATGIYPPEIGGPATYAKLLAERLPLYDMEVEILPFRMVRKYPKIFRHIAYCVLVTMRARKADVIFTQDPVSTGIPSILAGKLARKPVVMRVAGDYAWEQATQRYGVKDTIDEFQTKHYGMRVGILRLAQKLSVKYATVVISPSEYFKNLVNAWSKRKYPVRKIYNGIDFNVDFKKGEKYAIPTLITAGRLVPWKGFDVLITMMHELPEWRLVIAGDGPEREKLEARAIASGVAKRVEFTGNLPREELFSRMYRSHIFVLNTSFESFSFQVVEAMFVGVPVITTDIGNLKEIITPGEEGILVAPNDTDALLTAIRNISSDHALCERFVRAAHTKAELFSIEQTHAELTQVFKEVTRNGVMESK